MPFVNLDKIIQLNKNRYVSSLSMPTSSYSPHWLLAPCFKPTMLCALAFESQPPTFFFHFPNIDIFFSRKAREQSCISLIKLPCLFPSFNCFSYNLKLTNPSQIHALAYIFNISTSAITKTTTTQMLKLGVCA